MFTSGSLYSQSNFFTQNWVKYEGKINNNKETGERTRVNDREMSTNQSFSTRFEAHVNGLAIISIPDTITQLEKAELFCELWGGHPKTARKRFQINGGTVYDLPSEPTEEGNCEYLFPVIPFNYKELVIGTNALQFVCDRGDSFWGHFLMEEIAINCYYKPDAPHIKRSGLAGFKAIPEVKSKVIGETTDIWLDFTETLADQIAEVHYFGNYFGYDWNGSGIEQQWHGYQFKRKYTDHIGSSTMPPFIVKWDTRMLPDQGKPMAIKALVVFKNGLQFWSDILGGITFYTSRPKVQLLYPTEMPVPFWSRDKQLRKATIELTVKPENIEEAFLFTRIWDGGEGMIKEPFKMNGVPYRITAGNAPHELRVSISKVLSENLRIGTNIIELLSDTEHHGIEVCLPGPGLIIRYKE